MRYLSASAIVISICYVSPCIFYFLLFFFFSTRVDSERGQFAAFTVQIFAQPTSNVGSDYSRSYEFEADTRVHIECVSRATLFIPLLGRFEAMSRCDVRRAECIKMISSAEYLSGIDLRIRHNRTRMRYDVVYSAM